MNKTIAFWLLKVVTKLDPGLLQDQVDEMVRKALAIQEPPSFNQKVADVVSELGARQIKFTDWRKLPEAQRKHWSAEADACLNNKAFKTLYGYRDEETGELISGLLMKKLMENMFRFAEDIDVVKQARWAAIGMERGIEELRQMRYAKQESTHEDLNSTF